MYSQPLVCHVYNVSYAHLQVAMLVSAQREAGEAAEAAAKSIVKAALEDPRQFLGRQTRWLGRS